MALGKSYLTPYAFLAPLISIFFAVDNYLRICGKVKFSMYLNILMTIIGCVLEFLLLYVFRLDIWAAGFTYCFSLFICSVVGFYPFFKNNLLLKFVKPKFSFALIKRIVTSGFPTILSSISSRITSLFLNILLIKHGGQLAVAAYAVIIYIDGIIVSLLYGLSDSLQPAIGYNFGAKNKKRVNSLLKISYGSGGIISLLLILIVYFFGDSLISMFVNKNEMDLFILTKEALSIFSITFFFRWFASITQSYFTAIEKPKLALTLSTIMTFIVPCILLFTLPNKFGLNGLWSITPISSFIACMLALILFIKNQRTIVRLD